MRREPQDVLRLLCLSWAVESRHGFAALEGMEEAGREAEVNQKQSRDWANMDGIPARQSIIISH